MADTEPSKQTQPANGTELEGKVATLDINGTGASPSTSQATAMNGVSQDETKQSVAAAAVPAGPRKTIFLEPLSDCHPPSRPDLTEDQQKKYNELLASVLTWTEVPTTSARNAPKEAITDEDRLWLTRECLLRYLRATNWASAAAAGKRLIETLTWRREYGLAKFTPEYISEENETGKQVILGFDKAARPCLYMFPSKQNTARSDRQLHHLVFMLERCIDLMPAGQEMVALLINFKDTRSGQGASVSQGTETLKILQGHYPERLGRALISDLPWYITTFFKLISPFIDPVTKEKMKFNEKLTEYVPSQQLVAACGGEVDFEYVHTLYWPALNEECERRRTSYRQRWERAGKKIGESELYLRGGTETPAQADSIPPTA